MAVKIWRGENASPQRGQNLEEQVRILRFLSFPALAPWRPFSLGKEKFLWTVFFPLWKFSSPVFQRKADVISSFSRGRREHKEGTLLIPRGQEKRGDSAEIFSMGEVWDTQAKILRMSKPESKLLPSPKNGALPEGYFLGGGLQKGFLSENVPLPALSQSVLFWRGIQESLKSLENLGESSTLGGFPRMRDFFPFLGAGSVSFLGRLFSMEGSHEGGHFFGAASFPAYESSVSESFLGRKKSLREIFAPKGEQSGQREVSIGAAPMDSGALRAFECFCQELAAAAEA